MAEETIEARVSGLEKTVQELATRQDVQTVREEVHAVREEVHDLRDELHAVRDELRAEIRAGDEETRTYMRVLHEDVIERIGRLRG